MKVKCIKLTDTMTGKEKDGSDGSITVGNIYHVLSLSIDLNPDSVSYIRVESDDDPITPILVNIMDFEFVDHSIPSNFGIYDKLAKGYLDLEPRSWHDYKSERDEYDDFWEDLFDGERAAVELYRREVAFIKGELYEPLPEEKPSAQELLEIYRRKERDHLIPDQGFNKSFAPIALTSTDKWK